MTIQENIQKIKSNIPKNVELVAVSKTKPEADIMEAYNNGQRVFGENKVQDLVDKYDHLPKDIEWHFIGHLQTNKVKYLAPFVHLIHAVDSFKLLKEINKQGAKNKRVIKCLLQFHIANEQAKFGLNKEEAIALLERPELLEMENIQIVGVMGMATYTDDKNQIREEFSNLKNYFELIKKDYIPHDYFTEVSMGMSADYEIAIEEGSTIIRLGSTIFGARFQTGFKLP